MALSGIISEKKRNSGRKSWFFADPHAFDAPLGGPGRNIAIPFGVKKTSMVGLYVDVKTLRICVTI